jgi:hypothetical protein
VGADAGADKDLVPSAASGDGGDGGGATGGSGGAADGGAGNTGAGNTGGGTPSTGNAGGSGAGAGSGSGSSGGNTGAGTGSGSAGTGNTGGTSGGSSDTGATTPSRVWHEAWDEWVSEGHTETTVVHHEAVWATRPVYGTRCNYPGCGFVTTIPAELYAHQDETGHGAYSTGVQIGTEDYLLEDVWDENVEHWVDTSHTVHHEGYWE